MQVIVYVPPATVPQSARGQAQKLPAGVPGSNDQQPILAEGEAEAQADPPHLCAQPDHALPLGMPPNCWVQMMSTPESMVRLYLKCLLVIATAVLQRR